MMMRVFCRMFGLPARTAGGILCPGGSYSNLLAIVTARNFYFPGFKEVVLAFELLFYLGLYFE
jgi:glutamate/tyrosine decarboxylase-like PLP-dependent enzyme